MKNKERAVLVLEPDNPEEVVMKMKKTGIRTVQLHSLSYSEIKYLRWIEGFQRNPFERRMKVIRAVGLSEESLEGEEYQIFKLKKRGNRKFCKNL